MDTTWSETGDRYMLKLFRDYLFHQVTEDGRPWLDMSHIVQCLNKLETGSLERVSNCRKKKKSSRRNTKFFIMDVFGIFSLNTRRFAVKIFMNIA